VTIYCAYCGVALGSSSSQEVMLELDRLISPGLVPNEEDCSKACLRIARYACSVEAVCKRDLDSATVDKRGCNGNGKLVQGKGGAGRLVTECPRTLD